MSSSIKATSLTNHQFRPSSSSKSSTSNSSTSNICGHFSHHSTSLKLSPSDSSRNLTLHQQFEINTQRIKTLKAKIEELEYDEQELYECPFDFIPIPDQEAYVIEEGQKYYFTSKAKVEALYSQEALKKRGLSPILRVPLDQITTSKFDPNNEKHKKLTDARICVKNELKRTKQELSIAEQESEKINRNLKIFDLQIKKAGEGDQEAQYWLGEYYASFSETKFRKKSFHLFKKAASLGHRDAQIKVAECYRLGIGTLAHDEVSQLWRSAAQEEGEARLARLALLSAGYDCGYIKTGNLDIKLPNPDKEIAVNLFKLGYKQNFIPSMTGLAMSYWNGNKILPQNKPQAIKIFNEAVRIEIHTKPWGVIPQLKNLYNLQLKELQTISLYEAKRATSLLNALSNLEKNEHDPDLQYAVAMVYLNGSNQGDLTWEDEGLAWLKFAAENNSEMAKREMNHRLAAPL